MPIESVNKLKNMLNKSKMQHKSLKKKKNRKKAKKKFSNSVKLSVNLDIDSEKLFCSSIFRFINEKLYTSTSDQANDFFQDDPNAFKIYHEGYQRQLANWPLDPLKFVTSYILDLEDLNNKIIVDMGCGDARLHKFLSPKCKIRSFDLVAANENVEVCDFSHVPLEDQSVDIVVFCLSLMGTNIRDFIYEANRILKQNGMIIIIEVVSRFDGAFKKFLDNLKIMGFKIKHTDQCENKYFYNLRAIKIRSLTDRSVDSFPDFYLKPCVYKKR